MKERIKARTDLVIKSNGAGKYLVTGDTVFIRSIGRPDLGGMAEAWSDMLFKTMTEMLGILAANFKGHEAFRYDLLNSTPKYGNDDDEVDLLLRDAYLEANWGPEALEARFERWDWSRGMLNDGRCAVLYNRQERGEQTESLALLFDVPVASLWDDGHQLPEEVTVAPPSIDQIMVLRRKMLAIRLRQVRQAAGLSMRQ